MIGGTEFHHPQQKWPLPPFQGPERCRAEQLDLRWPERCSAIWNGMASPKEIKKHVGFSGTFWVWMEFNELSWDLMDFHGFEWNLMEGNRTQRTRGVSMNLVGLEHLDTWKHPTDILVACCAWLLGCACYLNIWDHMDVYENLESVNIKSGWWYTYLSEKIWLRQLGRWLFPSEWDTKSHANQILIYHLQTVVVGVTNHSE